MQFAEQTLTRRDGRSVVYRFHVGPNRAERRRAQFRRAQIAARRSDQMKTVRMFLTALGKPNKYSA